MIAFGNSLRAGEPRCIASSDSGAIAVTVTPEASTTTLAIFGFDQAGKIFPLTSTSYGSPAYLRADVSGQSGSGVPSGDVFFNDGVNFGLISTLNSQGNTETATGVFNLTPGSHAMVGRYLGNSSFSGSTSSLPINITVTAGSTTTSIISSASTAGFGSNVDLTATIGTSSAGLAPAGSVTFLSGGTGIGTVAALESRFGIGNLQTGQFQTTQSTATLSTAQLPLGQNTITAQYGGDTNYLASTSAPLVVNVVPDFSLPAALSPITITSPGQSGTTTLTITGKASYNGTINFTAASCSGLPSLATCSFSPTSVKGSGKTSITISTTAPHNAALQHLGFGRVVGPGVFLFGLPSQRQRRKLRILLAIACLATSLGCGGGGGSGGSQPIPGTPAGTYNIIVTATSSGLSHTTTFAVTVQ